MSDRSAKLLLEVARSIEHKGERDPCVKLAGDYGVPLNVGLVAEIATWARGYREHLELKSARGQSVVDRYAE